MLAKRAVYRRVLGAVRVIDRVPLQVRSIAFISEVEQARILCVISRYPYIAQSCLFGEGEPSDLSLGLTLKPNKMRILKMISHSL